MTNGWDREKLLDQQDIVSRAGTIVKSMALDKIGQLRFPLTVIADSHYLEKLTRETPHDHIKCLLSCAVRSGNHH